MLEEPCDWRARNQFDRQIKPERTETEAGMTMTSQIVEAAVLPSMQIVKKSHGQDGGGKEELQVTTVCLPIAKGGSDVIVQDGDGEVRLKEKRQVVPVCFRVFREVCWQKF